MTGLQLFTIVCLGAAYAALVATWFYLVRLKRINRALAGEVRRLSQLDRGFHA